MSAAGEIEGQRLSGVRGVIAQRMMDSLSGSAQLTYFADADVSSLLAQRAEWKAQGHAIGLEDCVIVALAAVLGEFPDFNAWLEDGVLTRLPQLDVSVAISAPTGLMTPVVRGANALSLSEVAAQRRDLVSRALAARLKVSEMKGGTFTISNLGLTRVRHFTPILNRPQVALLGLGRIEEVARRGEGGEVVWRKTMGLSLTADHRVLDGDPSGRFLAALCEALEAFSANP